MLHTFEMKNRSPTIRRPPRGTCIYCGSRDYRANRDRKLGEEHIIAEGLGGNLVLQEAACEACEDAIKHFEPSFLKTVLYAPRVHLGIRRKRRNRGEETIKIQGSANGKNIEINLPIKTSPVILFFAQLGAPGILIGRPINIADMRGAWVKHLNADAVLAPRGFQSFASPVLDTYKFSQFLAKIAHGFVVDSFGDSFTPLLRELIRNKHPTNQRYDLVGGTSDSEGPSDNLHELGAEWRPAKGITYAVVRIRLFANLGAPTYLVVAGTQRAT